MNNARMGRLTGAFALASVVIWLGIFPLYVVQKPISVYDGAATGQELFRIQSVVFTRILLGLALYVTLMIFAVGFRELIRRADAEYEWVGTLLVVPWPFGQALLWWLTDSRAAQPSIHSPATPIRRW